MNRATLNACLLTRRQPRGCLGLSLAGSDLVATLLYGVTPTTPHIFVLAVALLATTALAASIIPARRATRIDPVIALRTE